MKFFASLFAHAWEWDTQFFVRLACVRVMSHTLYTTPYFKGTSINRFVKNHRAVNKRFFAHVYACDGLDSGALNSNTYKRSVKPPFAYAQREVRCLYVFNKGFVFPVDRFTLEVRVR